MLIPHSVSATVPPRDAQRHGLKAKWRGSYKRAWRDGYYGLAAVIAVAWATQL